MSDQPAASARDVLRTMECPNCGGTAARADIDGCFHDGDALLCGCPGHVNADEEDVSVSCDDEPASPAAPIGDALDGPRQTTALDREYQKALDVIDRQRAEIDRLKARAEQVEALVREFVTLINVVWKDTTDGRRAKALADARVSELAGLIMDLTGGPR